MMTLSFAFGFAAGWVALTPLARNQVDAMMPFTNGGKRTAKPEALAMADLTANHERSALRTDVHTLTEPALAKTVIRRLPDFPLNNRDLRSRLRQKSRSRSDQAVMGQGDTVVLLHGLGRTTRSMRKIEKELSRNGFRVINVSYPSTRKSIETLADKYLAGAIGSQGRRTGAKIHFVTHSLGGIVLGYYLKHHPLPNLGRVVMLCPPHQGSEVADRWRHNVLYRFFTGPAGQQLGTAPSSLPNRLGPVPFELGVIAGNRSLNPFTSAIIPGPDDGKVAVVRAKVGGMKDFLVVPKSHTFIMRDPEVISQVIAFLNNGFFKKNPDSTPRPGDASTGRPLSGRRSSCGLTGYPMPGWTRYWVD